MNSGSAGHSWAHRDIQAAVFVIGALFFAVPAGSQAQVPPWQARSAAAETAAWAIETGNRDALADSIRLLLDNGGVVDPEAPWSAHDLLAALEAMDGGAALAEDIRAEQSRGVAIGGGALRYDLLLGAAEEHEIPLVMAQNEPALVEVRPYKGSDGADIDLWVYGPDTTLMGEDTGPESGIEGQMAFVQFTPDRCIPVTVRLFNAGAVPARIAVFAPAATAASCER